MKIVITVKNVATSKDREVSSQQSEFRSQKLVRRALAGSGLAGKILAAGGWLLLAFSLQLSAFSQTPVLFPVTNIFGGAWGGALTVNAVNTLVSDGQNLWAGTYATIPYTGQPVTNALYPGPYLLTVTGVRRAARFVVPPGTNVVNVNSLITSGPVIYFGTNLASLDAGENIGFVTNADGSLTINATAGADLADGLETTLSTNFTTGAVAVNVTTNFADLAGSATSALAAALATLGTNQLAGVLWTNSAVPVTLATNGLGRVTEFLATNLLPLATGNAQTNNYGVQQWSGTNIFSVPLTITGVTGLHTLGATNSFFSSGGITNLEVAAPAGWYHYVYGAGGTNDEFLGTNGALSASGGFTGGFTGNGGALTNLAAAAITGVLPVSALPAGTVTNVAGTSAATPSLAANVLYVPTNAPVTAVGFEPVMLQPGTFATPAYGSIFAPPGGLGVPPGNGGAQFGVLTPLLRNFSPQVFSNLVAKFAVYVTNTTALNVNWSINYRTNDVAMGGYSPNLTYTITQTNTATWITVSNLLSPGVTNLTFGMFNFFNNGTTTFFLNWEQSYLTNQLQ